MVDVGKDAVSESWCETLKAEDTEIYRTEQALFLCKGTFCILKTGCQNSMQSAFLKEQTMTGYPTEHRPREQRPPGLPLS